LSIFVTGYQAQQKVKPPTLLKLLGCRLISTALAEHSIEVGHNIDFNVMILEKVTGYMDRLVKEAMAAA
jgi:hypothetical protein